MNRLKSAMPPLRRRRTRPARTTVSGGPSEKHHSVGLTKAGYALFLPLTPILPLFLLSPSFSISCHFSCRPPHTLFRQDTARTSKKWQHYTAQSGHGARITHQNPVSCIKVCISKEEIMNPPLEGREAENMLSLCKSVQHILP